MSISITKRKKSENHTDKIIASVRDTGTGIPPEILPSIFSKFGSRSEMGTGLGLFISKILWKLMAERYGERITLMEKDLPL